MARSHPASSIFVRTFDPSAAGGFRGLAQWEGTVTSFPVDLPQARLGLRGGTDDPPSGRVISSGFWKRERPVLPESGSSRRSLRPSRAGGSPTPSEVRTPAGRPGKVEGDEGGVAHPSRRQRSPARPLDR